MAKILKATYFWENECEVTRSSSHFSEQAEVELAPQAEGCALFPNSPTERLDGAVRIKTLAPQGVVLATAGENYTVEENTLNRTPVYTRDGRHKWWYTFETITR
ncbi:MAG TPA: hypothetical protein IAC44_05990 [Candidatus Merdimorpha stercoravium]|uniref:Uncharacterized protein n=1 Tax=Candidatus Merdimorpha stercoravium TaxID=2840863 RepID=A0A9D1KUE8_9FLAO|nr:hypothetical protein [Candidatus Merdimorpha stercoravium]